MKLFKLLVTLIILCFIGLFIYENLQTWTQPVSFKLDLMIFQSNAGLELYLLILISVLIGFIVGLALLLGPYIKTRRLLKREQQDKKTLQKQLAMSRGAAESTGETAVPHAEQGAASEKEE